MENAQLFETTHRKTQELLTLRETNLDIASAQDTNRILQSVVERATNLLNAESGSIYLFHDEDDGLQNKIHHNLNPDYADLIIKMGGDLAGKIAEDSEPRLISNYKPEYTEEETHPENEFGPILAVPLIWKDEVKGAVVVIRNFQEPEFNEDDVVLLQMFASQAAIALENARLLDEAQSKASQLSTLHEVNRVISATLDRDAALELIMQKAVEILQTEAGSIFLVDESGKSLIFEIALGPTGVKLVGAKVPINSKSIAGSIAKYQRPMMVNSVSTDPRWNTAFDDATDFHTRDILGVPMIAFNRVIGVIELINKRNGRRFNNDDQTTLTIFAGQAAIAIVNAERFTETDQALASRVRELNILQLIDRELNATLDLQTVLNLTLSGTMDFLGASIGLIAMVDSSGENLYFRSMVGVAKEYELYREEPWSLTEGIIGKAVRTGKPIRIIDGELDNFASDSRSTSQLCVPLVLEDKVMGVISLELADPDFFTEKDEDFANRVASHATLAIQNAHLFEEVKAANQAKTEFMSVTSHELKIPMTSIKGYARMLMLTGTNLTDQQKEFVQVITDNVDRMNRLVADLLDVSRIEAGRVRLEMANVSLKDVVDEVIRSVDTQINEKNLHLTLNVPPTLPYIWGDRGRLVQIMTNLVSNAYKYTPEGGDIEVRATLINGDKAQEHDKISMAVIDTGFGISEEDQKKLFSKFFRASDQKIRNIPGTGLGLTITKNMIELHNGTMWFKSVYGKGSTFGFDVPVSQHQSD